MQYDKQALEFFNQAVSLQHSNPLMSYKLLVSALELDATLASAWHWLGDQNINHAGKFKAAGIACLRKCVEYDPTNAKIWCAIGHALYHSDLMEEAFDATMRAIELAPELANPWTNLSLIQSIRRQLPESLASAQKGYDLDPNPTTEMALGFAHLHARNLDLGLKCFEAKLSYAHQVYHGMPYARWQGEDLSGKTIFVISDQGMGDALDFLRFIPMVAKQAGMVVLQIQKEMIRLASFMLTDHENVVVVPLDAPFPGADYWVQNTSIPVSLGLSSDEIEHCPQLPVAIDQYSLEHFTICPKEKLRSASAKLNIGIAWKGNSGNAIDQHRSMKIEDFLTLYRVPNIQLFGLQVGAAAPEIHASGSAALVRDLPPYIRDTFDTACMLKHLDLVIAVESFMPHLCNAVQVPVWMPYSYLGGDWRVGRKGSRPIWHEYTRIFHQGEDSQWKPVMDEMTEALREMVK